MSKNKLTKCYPTRRKQGGQVSGLTLIPKTMFLSDSFVEGLEIALCLVHFSVLVSAFVILIHSSDKGDRRTTEEKEHSVLSVVAFVQFPLLLSLLSWFAQDRKASSVSASASVAKAGVTLGDFICRLQRILSPANRVVFTNVIARI